MADLLADLEIAGYGRSSVPVTYSNEKRNIYMSVTLAEGVADLGRDQAPYRIAQPR
jgi:hypothetical protein